MSIFVRNFQPMILLTGASGLVGSRVLYDLTRKGFSVKAIKRSSTNLKLIEQVFKSEPELLNKVEWIEAEITDVYAVKEALSGMDTVIHAAGFISFLPSDFNQMMKINAEGTANLVNMALEEKVRKFIHVSSVAALGRSEQNRMIDENFFWKTSSKNSGYAISKYSAEREVWRAIEEGLDAVIVNPSIVIGPGDWEKGSARLISQVYRGLKFYSEGVTGFVDVRDVSRAILLLMEKDIRNERFILNSENISYKELFFSIAEYLGKKPPSIRVTSLLAELAWRGEKIMSWLPGYSPVITKETARNSLCKWYYSGDKIKDRLNMEYIPIQQSLKDTCGIFLEEVKK